jgi:hypothetical protein
MVVVGYNKHTPLIMIAMGEWVSDM